MKITKKQLRRIIKEELGGGKIDDPLPGKEESYTWLDKHGVYEDMAGGYGVAGDFGDHFGLYDSEAMYDLIAQWSVDRGYYSDPIEAYNDMFAV